MKSRQRTPTQLYSHETKLNNITKTTKLTGITHKLKAELADELPELATGDKQLKLELAVVAFYLDVHHRRSAVVVTVYGVPAAGR